MWENCHKFCEKSGQRLSVSCGGLSSAQCSGLLEHTHQAHSAWDPHPLGCVRQHLAGSPANRKLVVSSPRVTRCVSQGHCDGDSGGESGAQTCCKISPGSLLATTSFDPKFLLGVFPELKYYTKNTFN